MNSRVKLLLVILSYDCSLGIIDHIPKSLDCGQTHSGDNKEADPFNTIGWGDIELESLTRYSHCS